MSSESEESEYDYNDQHIIGFSPYGYAQNDNKDQTMLKQLDDAQLIDTTMQKKVSKCDAEAM